MKKISKILCIAMMFLVSGLIFSACGETEFKSAYVKTGTIATTIVKGEQLDLSNVKAVFVNDDDSILEVGADNLTFGLFDSSTTGDKKLKIAYKGYTFEVTIKVVATEADVSSITLFESELMTKYTANSGTKTNKNEEFVHTQNTMKVGDDNLFDFQIKANGIDGNGVLVENLSKVRTNIIIESTNGQAYTILDGDALTAVATVDTENSTIDFTDAAVGNTYRITVSAANYDPAYFDNAPSFTTTVEVVDGYNVYTEKELSLMDNANQNGYWTTLKEEWGYTDISPKSLVLMNTLELTTDVMPSNHFYTREELYTGDTLKDQFNSVIRFEDENGNLYEPERVGSLKDNHEAVYQRYIADGEEFAIYGNYFEIDASQIPTCLYGLDTYTDAARNGKHWYASEGGEGGKSYVCMHKTLLRFQGTSYNTENGYVPFDEKALQNSTGTGYVYDTYFIGNGGRDDRGRASGGFVLSKANSVNFEANNTIHKDFHIGWFAEYGYDYTGADLNPETMTSQSFYIAQEGNPTLNAKQQYIDSKGYNSYSSLFYVWGCPNVYIEGGEYIGAGGPVIVADHVSPGYQTHVPTGNNTTLWNFGGASYIDAVNCKMESFVNGQEPWFVTFGQEVTAAIQQFIQADALYTASNKTILQNGRINMLLIYKHGEKKMAEAGYSRGYMRVFDTVADYSSYYNEDTKGKLADGTTYYGYDRTIDWTQTTNVGQIVQGKYSGPGAWGNMANMLANASTPGNAEQIRLENSTTGHSNSIQLGDSGVYTGNWTNIYMSNGFGSIFKIFDRVAG